VGCDPVVLGALCADCIASLSFRERDEQTNVETLGVKRGCRQHPEQEPSSYVSAEPCPFLPAVCKCFPFPAAPGVLADVFEQLVTINDSSSA